MEHAVQLASRRARPRSRSPSGWRRRRAAGRCEPAAPSIALASSIAVVVSGQIVVHSESLKASITTLPRKRAQRDRPAELVGQREVAGGTGQRGARVEVRGWCSALTRVRPAGTACDEEHGDRHDSGTHPPGSRPATGPSAVVHRSGCASRLVGAVESPAGGDRRAPSSDDRCGQQCQCDRRRARAVLRMLSAPCRRVRGLGAVLASLRRRGRGCQLDALRCGQRGDRVLGSRRETCGAGSFA